MGCPMGQGTLWSAWPRAPACSGLEVHVALVSCPPDPFGWISINPRPFLLSFLPGTQPGQGLDSGWAAQSGAHVL